MKIAIGAVILIIFICVHLIKMMRLYLIVMDRKVSFDRFVPAYLRTTLVNLVIPYKIGEIYRIVVFSRISGGFKTGFFSVLIDRFFDTLALCLILLPYQILFSGFIPVSARLPRCASLFSAFSPVPAGALVEVSLALIHLFVRLGRNGLDSVMITV